MKIYDSADNVILDVVPDDSSYRYREIMGDNRVTLYYQLAEHVEIPVGAYIVFEGARYTLYSPEKLAKKHSRYFDYTVVFEAEEVKARTWKVRNTVDRRLKFSLTAKPKEHLEMIVANLNAREKGWSVGAYVDDAEKCINYNHTYIYEALGMIATEFGTEFEFVGKTVSLHKVEYGRDAPLALSYGRGNGLKSGVGRTSGDKQPVEILYTEGGEKNIDASKYGARELHLPKSGEIGFDGIRFEDEDGYDSSRARVYVADADGYSIRRKGATLTGMAEDSLDCTDIYPKRVGKVTAVVTVDETRNFYDIVDNGIPEALDYSDCLIAGEKMTIIFQSGMLAGREFDCKYCHTEKGEKAARRFEIVPAEIDGVTMPGGSYIPAVNDTYAVFNVMLPDAYINDAETKTGAEWEMMRTAVRYLYDNEERKMTFSGSLDGIWSKKDWANIGGKIRLGGFVSLSDTQFQATPVLVRITGIKDYINRPYSPEVELSNETVTSGFTGTIGDLKGDEVTIEDNARQAREYAKRGFRDARETMQMLQEAMLDFTGAISPIAVQTMQMIVGDESLQYRFVKNKANPVPDTDFAIVYGTETKQLTVTASVLQHMTLGINDISGSHAADEYSYWDMEAFVSAALTDAAKSYYLYAKCSKTEETGSFVLSETPIRMEGVDGYYHFLSGILNRERDGERSFATVFGFTEILPGQILTEKIRSSDGNTWWDLSTGNFNMRNRLTLDGNTLTLNGALVQTGSGATTVIGAYCGAYSSSRKYQLGDEVYAAVGGVTSTYRYINSVAGAGHGVTDGNYWIPVARGAKGSPGTPGEDGKDGRGIASTVVEYAVSSDGSTAPVAGWSETIPAVSAGFYLWTRTTTTYTDSTVSVSYSVSRAGTDGKAGAACPYQGDYDNTKTYYGNDYRCDVVRYNNRYYRALPTAGGSFSGRIPTNTAYWTPFGASFDNIATGFLFAEEAWVENLGVSFLKTGSSGKRVLINEDGNNDIAVYNGNEERVRITGDSIGALSSLFVRVVNGLSASKAVMNDVADMHSKEIDYYSLLYGYSIPYEIKQGDTFSLRAVKGELTTALPSRVEQDPDGSTSVMYTGIEIVYTLYNGETAVKTLARVGLTGGTSGDDVYVQSTDVYDYTRPVLQEGETTTLTDSGWSVKVTFHAYIQSDYVINRLTSTSAKYGFDAYIIRAGKRKMLIGSDGFYYVIGPQQYVFVSNNDSISLRAGNAGLTLKDDELKLRLGGTEYKVSALNNTIRLTAV